MAVQAQFPSSMLFFNRNGQQEGKDNGGIGIDYSSLQAHQGNVATGFVLDHQSHILFNNGVLPNPNPRKRGREPTNPAAATKANTTTTTTNINPFQFSLDNNQQQQQQQHNLQIIDLSQQQRNHHSNVVSTGLRLSFDDNHHQHHQQQQFQPHQQQQQQHNLNSSSSLLLSLLSEDFANQIKQQTDELNQFIHAQGEQLRRTLAEKRARHYRLLIAAAEERVARRLNEKQSEVEKANRRNAELEARATELTAEAQAWQAKAQSQEAQAQVLQAQLHHALSTMSAAAVAADGDGAAIEGEKTGAAEDAESAYVDPDREVGTGGICGVSGGCRVCRRRMAKVVVLPCRHLCVCAECDGLVRACPLCLGPRNGGVEVFLS